jgi:nucleoside-diphosphate-sugar epimerase
LIAVTGATGFIGRTISMRLVAAGYRVRALARSPGKAAVLQAAGVTCMAGSLEDDASLRALVDGACAVIHCAGAVRGATQQQFDRVNVAGVRRLLRALERRDGTPRLLSLSSLAAREPRLSYYAASKRGGEQVLINEARRTAWVALRPPAVYGPGDRELLPLFRAMARGFAPLPGNAEARFSMLFVDDLAGAVLAWLRCDRVANGVYPLDDGRAGGYDWREVAEIVERLCRRPVRLVRIPAWLPAVPAWLNMHAARLFGYAPMLTPQKLRELRHADWVCDSAALTGAIGWEPRVQLEEGLRRTPGWPGYQGLEGPSGRDQAGQ